MLKHVVRAVVFGLIGLVVVPILVFFAVLVLVHTFDPRCGTPGDSGGCEMGAASIAYVSALPGLLGGIGLGVMLAWREQRRIPKP